MPSPRSLRSLLGTASATALTGAIWYHLRTGWNLCFWMLALALFAFALCAPRLFAPVQTALDQFGRAITTTLAFLLLGVVFGLIFIPGRLLLALLHRDPLHRHPEPSRASYWEPLPPTGNVDHFRRQY